MLKKLLIENYKKNPKRYEIESNNTNSFEVWDKELLKSFEFIFDDNDNLIEIW